MRIQNLKCIFTLSLWIWFDDPCVLLPLTEKLWLYVTKNKIVPFTNISMFRTAGSITAGRVEKIGSTGGTCMELLATPSSRRRQMGTGWKGSIMKEVERLEQAPDFNS